jgi:8-oxo-dGTP pyrophosphatase MutT (NUDIX family)
LGNVTPTHPVDVLLLLTAGDQLLLALREGTGYADGQWNLPSGKLEVGEDAVSAMRREALEEVGIRLAADDLTPAATVHYRSRGGQGRVGLVFTAEWDPSRHGKPVNAEPQKCGGIAWFPVHEVPPSTYRYSAVCVSAWRSGERFWLDGWTALT